MTTKVRRIERWGRYTLAEVELLPPLPVFTDTNTTPAAIKPIVGRGISRKSDKDQFNKAMAENIAIGRATAAAYKKFRQEEIHDPFMG